MIEADQSDGADQTDYDQKTFLPEAKRLSPQKGKCLLKGNFIAGMGERWGRGGRED